MPVWIELMCWGRKKILEILCSASGENTKMMDTPFMDCTAYSWKLRLFTCKELLQVKNQTDKLNHDDAKIFLLIFWCQLAILSLFA